MTQVGSFFIELMAFSLVVHSKRLAREDIPKHSSNASLTAAHRFRKLSRDQIDAGLCIPLKEADAKSVTQDYLAEPRGTGLRTRCFSLVMFLRTLWPLGARKENRSTGHLTATRSRRRRSRGCSRQRSGRVRRGSRRCEATTEYGRSKRSTSWHHP
jgi:hypothetical protein